MSRIEHGLGSTNVPFFIILVSPGAIVGICISGIVVLVSVLAITCLCYRRRSKYTYKFKTREKQLILKKPAAVKNPTSKFILQNLITGLLVWVGNLTYYVISRLLLKINCQYLQILTFALRIEMKPSVLKSDKKGFRSQWIHNNYLPMCWKVLFFQTEIHRDTFQLERGTSECWRSSRWMEVWKSCFQNFWVSKILPHHDYSR